METETSALTEEELPLEARKPAKPPVVHPSRLRQNVEEDDGHASAENEPLRDPNTIYVGKKGLMSYVLAVVSQFNAGAPEVKIKARGKAISRAVDVSQVVKNRYVKDVRIELADISTEELTSEDGTPSRVSSLLLKLTK